MKKKEARTASTTVVSVETPSHLDFCRYLIVIFFLTHGSCCKILAYNLSRYCICSPYYCYTCDLNILGTRIEALILSIGTGYDHFQG
jgi:hypothetical protein